MSDEIIITDSVAELSLSIDDIGERIRAIKREQRELRKFDLESYKDLIEQERILLNELENENLTQDELIEKSKLSYKITEQRVYLERILNDLGVEGLNVSDRIVDLEREDLKLKIEKSRLEKEYNLQKHTELTITEKINSVIDGGNKFISGGNTILKGVLGNWSEIDQAASTYQRTVGGTNILLERMRKSTNQMVVDYGLANKLGLSSTEFLKLQLSYSQSIGRNLSLTQQQLVDLGGVSQVIGDANAIALNDSLETMGLSTDDANQFITNLFNESTKRGLTFSKVSQEFVNNLKVAQTYTFKDGLNSLEKMSMNASKIRLEMKEILGFADKLTTVEGATEIAARFQVLGGPLSQIGANPLSLMYEATNDPEALQEKLINALSSMVVQNREDGRLQYTVVGQQMIKEVSQLTGIDRTKLSDTGTTLAKQNLIENQLGNAFNDNQDFREYFINTSSWDKERQQWGINDLNGNFVTQKDLLQNQGLLTELIESRKADFNNTSEIYQDTKSYKESVDNFIKAQKDTQAQIGELIGDNVKNIATSLGNSNLLLNAISITSTAIAGFTGTMAMKEGLLGTNKGLTSQIAPSPSGAGWKGLGKGFKNTTKGVGVGAVGMLAGAGVDMVKDGLKSSGTIEDGSGWDKGLNIGSKALQFGSMGLMLGGPWGALIGAVGGLGYALWENTKATKETANLSRKERVLSQEPIRMATGGLLQGPSHEQGGIKGWGGFGNVELEGNEFIVNEESTRKNFGLINEINKSKDTIKPNKEPLGKILTVEKSETIVNNNNSLTQTIEIEPLNIKLDGSIKLESNGKTVNLDKEIINNPVFINKLTEMITKQMNVNVNGSFNRSKIQQKF